MTESERDNCIEYLIYASDDLRELCRLITRILYHSMGLSEDDMKRLRNELDLAENHLEMADGIFSNSDDMKRVCSDDDLSDLHLEVVDLVVDRP